MTANQRTVRGHTRSDSDNAAEDEWPARASSRTASSSTRQQASTFTEMLQHAVQRIDDVVAEEDGGAQATEYSSGLWLVMQVSISSYTFCEAGLRSHDLERYGSSRGVLLVRDRR